MPDDIRLQTTILRHYKFRKLRQRLGDAGFVAWLSLVFWVADSRADGDLSGLSAEDLEMIAEWRGEAGALVSELLSLRLLVGEPGSFSLHQWLDHQPYIAERPLRIAKARKAAQTRWSGLSTQHVVDSREVSLKGEFVPVACSKHPGSKQEACNENTCSNAPSLPLPSTPSPPAAPTTSASSKITGAKPSSSSVEKTERPLTQIKKLAREKSSPANGRPKDPLRAELYDGVFRKKISNAFFDSRTQPFAAQLRCCVQEAVTSLVTNRVGKIAQARLDGADIEKLAMEKLGIGVETLQHVGDFSKRSALVTRAVVQRVVDAAAELLESRATISSAR